MDILLGIFILLHSLSTARALSDVIYECPGNQEYMKDVSSCMPTCANLEPDWCQTMFGGCRCPPGLPILGEDGITCITEAECPPGATRMCPSNQVFDYHLGVQKTCFSPWLITDFLVEKCGCLDSELLDVDGQTCISEEDCPPICKENQQLNLVCGNTCIRTCEKKNNPCSKKKKRFCVKGCECPPSHPFLAKDGVTCVDSLDCALGLEPLPPPPPTDIAPVPGPDSCPGNQIKRWVQSVSFADWPNACTPRCNNPYPIGLVPIGCPDPLYTCACPLDKPILLEDNIWCVEEKYCPLNCLANQVWRRFSEPRCSKRCDGKCESEWDNFDTSLWAAQCTCPADKPYLAEDGMTCESCAPECPDIQEYTDCGTACPLTCDNPQPQICTRQCVPRCQCPPEAPYEKLDADGNFIKCVTKEDCCTDGKVWDDCGSACSPTCEDPDGPDFCILVCIVGCRCPDKKPIEIISNGKPKCIKPSKCPKQKCTGGQVWKKCGSFCTPTCEDPYPICVDVCVSRCECPPNKPLWDPVKKKCIKESKCDPCVLPKKVGPCKALIPRWFFDSDTGSCTMFSWGGCEPNANNFPSLESCVDACGPTCPIVDCFFSHCPGGFRTDANGCQNSCECNCKCKKKCGKKKVCVFDDQQQQQCVFPVCEIGQPASNILPPLSCANVLCAAGYTCVQTDDAANCCPINACQLQPDSGCGNEFLERWYFDSLANECRLFYYGGSKGNDNNFLSKGECKRACMPRTWV